MNVIYLPIFYYFPVLFLVLGTIIIALFFAFSQHFIDTFPLFFAKMRILYGYISGISIIISYTFSFYYYGLFLGRVLSAGSYCFSPFNAMVFTVLTISNIVFCLTAIQQFDTLPDKNPLPFLGIIIIQSGIYLASFTITTISLLLGIFLVIFGATIYLVTAYTNKGHENKELLSSITRNNAIILGLLILGFSAHYAEYGSFNLYISNETQVSFLSVLSFSFIISALLLFMGVWPFHSIYFRSISNRLPSYPFLIFIINRIVAIVILVKYVLAMNFHPFNQLSIWLFVVLGGANLILNAISTITEQNLQKLFSQLSLVQIGIIFLVLAELIQEFHYKLRHQAAFALVYNVFTYSLIFAFAFSASNNFIYKFKTDTISYTQGLGRKNIPIFLAILFSLLFATVFPFSVGFFAKQLVISLFIQSTKIYFVIILFVVLAFVLVPIIRFIHIAFMERPHKETKEYYVELGVNMALFFSFLIIIGATILGGIFLHFFAQMAVYPPFI